MRMLVLGPDVEASRLEQLAEVVKRLINPDAYGNAMVVQDCLVLLGNAIEAAKPLPRWFALGQVRDLALGHWGQVDYGLRGAVNGQESILEGLEQREQRASYDFILNHRRNDALEYVGVALEEWQIITSDRVEQFLAI